VVFKGGTSCAAKAFDIRLQDLTLKLPTHVLELRINGEDIPRSHRRQIGNTKIRLHRAKLLSRSSHERIGINRGNRPDNEESNQAKSSRNFQ
jgi:hypothetical protein